MDKSMPADALSAALARSIMNGTFIDTKYYLFSCRLLSGKVGKPKAVYASSAAMKSAGDYFVAQLSGGFDTDQDMPINHETEAYGYDSDSDLEDTADEFEAMWLSLPSKGSNTGDIKGKGKEGVLKAENENISSAEASSVQRTLYSIVIGDIAATTWQAMIYYIYTGTIHFAPLKSGGISVRENAQREHRRNHPNLPRLCSPKSMYRLADIVGLDSLKRLAEEDIQTKTVAKTIVPELFSTFTSTYPAILDMQFAILHTTGLLPEMEQVRKKIREIVSGNLPHTENVLVALLNLLSSLLPQAKPKAPPVLTGTAKPA